MEITHLTPEVAQPLRDQWTAQQPKRVQALLTIRDPQPTAPTEHLGICDDGQPIAVVTLQLRGAHRYQVHLAIKKGVGASKLFPALCSIRNQLVNELKVQEITVWVPRRHPGLQRLAEAAGFEENGAVLLQGVGKRIVELRQLVYTHE